MLLPCRCALRLGRALALPGRHAPCRPRARALQAPRAKARLVLGIETSCDDTAAAVVSSCGLILGEACASQSAIHSPYGGVVPRLAASAHADNIDAVVALALSRAHVQPSALSAVAVTLGPGLAMCLRVGVLKARALAAAHGLALVNIHHMEAHALVARLCGGGRQGSVQFPFVAALVSGGHNLVVLCRGVGQYTVLGATLDDAIGEAYDKTARLLGCDVGGGGGAALEALALRGDEKRFAFTPPLRTSQAHRGSCEFSYAGLKTAVRLRIARELGAETAADRCSGDEQREQTRADIAAAFQAAAVAHLAERTARALGWAKTLEPTVATLVLAGGVASNAVVRSAMQRVADRAAVALAVPPPRLCTDNGVMVAWAGCERLELGIHESALPPGSGSAFDDSESAFVDLKPRWPLGERHPDCLPALQAVRSLRTVRLPAALTAA